MRFAIALLCLLPGLAFPDYGRVFVDRIVRVYDGDTITVTIEQWPPIVGEEIGVRINGIDTPEIRGECKREKELARQAREFVLAQLAAAQTVELRNIDRGKYFRVVADVYVDGENLADRVLSAGLAYRYDGGKKQGWCPAL